jgi:hypothetical protein
VFISICWVTNRIDLIRADYARRTKHSNYRNFAQSNVTLSGWVKETTPRLPAVNFTIIRAEFAASLQGAKLGEGYKAMATNVPDGFPIEVANEASPSILLDASLTWHDVQDDFTLRYEGHIVGRIRLAADACSVDSLWEWQITVPMEMPEWARGSACSREECVLAFGIALGRLLAEKGPERLERAWDLERAAEARRSKLSTLKPPERLAVELEDAGPKEPIPLEDAGPREPIPPSKEDALAAIARALSHLTTDNLL